MKHVELDLMKFFQVTTQRYAVYVQFGCVNSRIGLYGLELNDN